MSLDVIETRLDRLMAHEVRPKIFGHHLTSELVYPLQDGYYYCTRLHKKWVETTLAMQYRYDDMDWDLTIGNKYAVPIEVNNGDIILIVNHDGKYYEIRKEGKNG